MIPAHLLPANASVAFLSTSLPKACGLATYGADLMNSLGDDVDKFLVAVDDEAREFPDYVRRVIEKQDVQSYRDAAEFLNRTADALCLQHEYGIFGGDDGAHVIELMRALRIPVVTTCHTVLERPSENQRRVLRRIADLSASVMVMSDKAMEFMVDVYGVPASKVEVIPHGVPESDGVEPAEQMTAFGDDPKLLTFGLLSPGKGIEVALDAVARIAQSVPNVRYFVLGKTHPDLVRREGEAYREMLQQKARDLGIEENVVFVNEFATLEKLCTYLAGADVYVTPYRGKDQIVSGTLSYAVSFGLPIVSTPFVYAAELAAKDGAVLFPFDDDAKLADLTLRLLQDPKFRGRLRTTASVLGRTMRWPVVGQSLAKLIARAIESARPKAPTAARLL